MKIKIFQYVIINEKGVLLMKYKFFDKESLEKIKPWLLLSLIVMLMGFFIFNFNRVTSAIQFVLDLFRSFIYAIMFAYVLNIPMKHIEGYITRHTKKGSFLNKIKRVISMFLTFLFAALLVALITSIILPSIITSLIQLMQNLTSFFINIVKNIDAILAHLNIEFRVQDLQQVEKFLHMPWEQIVSNTVNFLSGSASGIVYGAQSFISSFTLGFTSFMFSLYLLSGKENYIRQLRKVSVATFGYHKSKVIFEYAHRVNMIFSKFIGGQLTEACILWILYYVLMRIFHFPYPELICTLIAIFSFVPVFGPMFAMLIGAVMMLSVNPVQSFWFIIFYQVVSYFEDNIIYPRVVGNSVGLPGLWVLLCIFIFGDLWGILGMVLAVPTTASVYVFFSEYINKKLKREHLVITDQNVMYESDYEEKEYDLDCEA